MIARLNLLSFLGLTLIGLAGLWWLRPPGAPFTAWLIAATVFYGPLLVFVPALVTRDRRLLTWLCFVLLFYFCVFVTQLLDPPPMRTLAVAKLGLTVMTFVLSVLTLRESRPRDR